MTCQSVNTVRKTHEMQDVELQFLGKLASSICCNVTHHYPCGLMLALTSPPAHDKPQNTGGNCSGDSAMTSVPAPSHRTPAAAPPSALTHAASCAGTELRHLAEALEDIRSTPPYHITNKKGLLTRTALACKLTRPACVHAMRWDHTRTIQAPSYYASCWDAAPTVLACLSSALVTGYDCLPSAPITGMVVRRMYTSLASYNHGGLAAMNLGEL